MTTTDTTLEPERRLVTFRTPAAAGALPLVAATLGKALADGHGFKLELDITTGNGHLTETVAGALDRFTLRRAGELLIVDIGIHLEAATGLLDLIDRTRITTPIGARTDPITGAIRALLLNLELDPNHVDNPGDNQVEEGL